MRQGHCKRSTNETTVEVSLGIDGAGVTDIETGIGFLNHMLEQFARHGFIDLSVSATGDLNVDAHHTVEDVGLAIGIALRQAIGEARGIGRFGSVSLPMDDALSRATIDISGRPFLGWHGSFPGSRIQHFDTELVQEFFHAVAMQAHITLHIELVHGHNTHHAVECCFKAVGRALRSALELDSRASDRIPSTKGVLGTGE